MKRVFLTGATGTIGSAVVPRLLADPDTEVCLLLRANDDDELRARFRRMLAYWDIAPENAQVGRLFPMRGDITQPGLGVSAAEYARLATETTHMIHCAASVKLTMTLEEARTTAVMPTRTILDLGRRCAAGGSLRKIDLVSTVGVWGRTPGFMPERRLPEVQAFHNTYEAGKAEAERLIWAEGDGLPITVHRPSMVVGETKRGRVMHFQVFYHLCEFLSGSRTFGIMPRLGDTRLDTVPVDWVADAICWSSDTPGTAGRILHLCSGPDQAIPLMDLQQRVRDAWAAHGRALPNLRWLDRRLLERLIPLISAVAGTKTKRALRALPPVLAYLSQKQGFSNTDSVATLASAGLPVPQVDSYLRNVLSFYLDTAGPPAKPTTAK